MGMHALRRGACSVIGPWLGAVVLALGGCGGGGGGSGGGSGGDTPPPSQPVSSLAIRASASATVAGGAGVGLDAVLLNATGPVQWSLDGPGSLSAASGTTVHYTPPPSDEQRVAGTARIVASARELVQTLTLGLTPAVGAPAPVPGRRWEVVSYPKVQTTDLVWLNGRFFAVNVIGGVIDSTDGIIWTPRPTPGGQLMAITQGPAGFLAVGRDTVLRSADGNTWVNAGATGTFDYWDVAAGLGVYVAAGQGGLALSADGASWTPVGPSIGRGLAVAFGAGRFVAAANVPTLYTSADGRTWAALDLANTAVNAAGVAYGNGRFVVVTDSNHYTSADGVSWTRRLANGITGFKLRFANGVFHLSGIDRIWSSTDGETWNEIFRTNLVTRIGGAAEFGGRAVIADGLGQIRYRVGAGALHDALSGQTKHITGMAAVDGAFHAVTDWGQVLRSSDGRSWETVAELAAGFRGIAHGNGRFVAASDTGAKALYTSPDGRNWTAADDGGTFPRMSSVAYGNGVFVASGSYGEVLRSEGGQSWQLLRTPVTVELTGVAYGAGRFMAVSIQGHVITSTDGLTWTEVRSDMGRMSGITYGTQGFVAVGGWGTGAGFLWTSPSGLDWTQRSDSATPSLIAVGHGSGRYVASGHNGAVLLSDDGLSWQRRSIGVFPNLYAVAILGGRLVVAGSGGAVVLSEQ